MDSLAFAQLCGSLAHVHGFRVSEEALYLHNASLDWLVRHSAGLRNGELPSLPTPSSTATRNPSVAAMRPLAGMSGASNT